MLAGFGGAIEALRAADAIDADEVHDWNSRMHVALGLAPLEPSPPGFKGARAVFIGEGEPPAPPPDPPVAQFLGLLPVSDADRPIPYGGRLQILGVERYDTAVSVAWRFAPLPDAELQYADELLAHDRDTEGLPEEERTMMRQHFLHRLDRPAQKLALTDDLATDYQYAGGSASGGGNEQTGRARFFPGIPHEAATLTVHWDELAFPVAL
jgi:hypothetical protein